MRGKDSRRIVTTADVESWQKLAREALSDADRQTLEKSEQAFVLYAGGASMAEIKRLTGISRQLLHYRLRRCMTPSEDGNAIGWHAVVGSSQIVRSDERKNCEAKLSSGIPRSGSLQALFAKYRPIHSKMLDMVRHGQLPGSKRKDPRLTITKVHEVFKTLCTAEGIAPPNYPFCSEGAGWSAVSRWAKKEKADFDRVQRKTRLAAALDNAWTVHASGTSRCYDRVECDGLHLDVNWTIEVPSVRGEGVIVINVTRIWIIALIECASSAVIGYSVAICENYNASDVARAVRSSLVPWKPRDLTVTTIAYKPGECLPNAAHPGLAYVRFGELHLDNAKANLADLCLQSVHRTAGATLVFGPRAAPNCRPNIEMLFDLLQEAGVHVMDGTTGSHPNDPRRDRTKGTQYRLSIDLLLDLCDLLIVRYNTGLAPGTSLSRIDVLKRAVEQETTVFRRVPEQMRQNCLKYDIFEMSHIGSEGGKPILRWRDARYSGSGLYDTPGIVGSAVLVMANSEDLRVIEVILAPDGTSLGCLDVEKRMRGSAHSIRTRKQVRRHMTNDGYLRHAADIPLAFRAQLEIDAAKSSKARRKLAEMAVIEAKWLKSIEVSRDDQFAAESTREIEKSTVSIADDDYISESSEYEKLLDGLGTVYR